MLGLAGAFASVTPVRAEPTSADAVPRLSIGVGQFDSSAFDTDFLLFDVSDDGHDQDKAVDLRLEYRFGTSLLPVTEPYASVKPWVGGEVTSDGSVFGAGGILIDIPLGPFVFTPSFGAGLWASGNGKDMGSPFEFRSQLELGYQFENQSRFSVSYSHMSNASLGDSNPGANTVSLYYHLPTRWLLGD